MTIAELVRYMASKKRQVENEQRIRATMDYIQADLIGKSISRIYSSSATMPDISEAYPSLFDSKEIQAIKQEKKQELSAIRFKEFANSFNKRFKEVAKETDGREISN